jgi:hypothetical protein
MRSGEGEKGRCLPWSKEEEGAYVFWMKQVPGLVPVPGLQLLLVFIMKSAKNVIKNYFFYKKKSMLQYAIYFYKIYPSFRKKAS